MVQTTENVLDGYLNNRKYKKFSLNNLFYDYQMDPNKKKKSKS